MTILNKYCMSTFWIKSSFPLSAYLSLEVEVVYSPSLSTQFLKPAHYLDNNATLSKWPNLLISTNVFKGTNIPISTNVFKGTCSTTFPTDRIDRLAASTQAPSLGSGYHIITSPRTSLCSSSLTGSRRASWARPWEPSRSWSGRPGSNPCKRRSTRAWSGK